MAVQEDDLGSEQTLKKRLELTNAIWENGSGTIKDKIMLPGNCSTAHIYTQPNLKSMEVKCVMGFYVR